jgi:preprotein translocase subunit SecE
VARNRKRAKERQRSRRPESAVSRRRAATTRTDLEDDIPEAIRHAAPDVELAEAQMALGRPELADEAAPEPDEDEFESLEDEVGQDQASVRGSRRGGPPSDGAGTLTAPGGHAPEKKVGTVSRLVNFLQGSWRELQRVQWPDRRQVVQATGVVIGFVIVAGAFLGVADLVATKLMKFILG